QVRLYHSTMSSVEKSLQTPPPVMGRYFIAPTASAYTSLFDFTYEGSPGNYQTFAWGFNDACVNLPPWDSYVPRGTVVSDLFKPYNGPTSKAGSFYDVLREHVAINTYAETAPFSSVTRFVRHGPRNYTLTLALKGFQIGIDRIQVSPLISPLPYTP